VEDFAVANDVPLRQHGEAAFGEPRCLDIEFLVSLEVVSKGSKEFVGHDAALVVGAPALLESPAIGRFWLLYTETICSSHLYDIENLKESNRSQKALLLVAAFHDKG